MSILYWAILLDEPSKERLLCFTPVTHPNVYAEHITLSFNPNEQQNKKWQTVCGKRIKIKTCDYYEDKKGQAITVSGIHRDDKAIPHITISCAEGTKPVYSNELIKGKKRDTIKFDLTGTFVARTENGWIKSKKL